MITDRAGANKEPPSLDFPYGENLECPGETTPENVPGPRRGAGPPLRGPRGQPLPDLQRPLSRRSPRRGRACGPSVTRPGSAPESRAPPRAATSSPRSPWPSIIRTASTGASCPPSSSTISRPIPTPSQSGPSSPRTAGTGAIRAIARKRSTSPKGHSYPGPAAPTERWSFSTAPRARATSRATTAIFTRYPWRAESPPYWNRIKKR